MRNPHADSDTDRGVSIAVTHVLTISITTILIAMLLMSGSTLLESEKERSAQSSLETVGERLAGEIANVDQMVTAGETESVTVTADHPRTVSNSQYTIQLLHDCSDNFAPLINTDTACLQLSAQDIDVTTHVPVPIDLENDGEAVAGGPVAIIYDGDEIVLEEANR